MSSPASATGASWSKPASTPISSSSHMQSPAHDEPGADTTSASPPTASPSAPPPQRAQRTPRTREASPIISPQSSLTSTIGDSRSVIVQPAASSSSSSSSSPAFAPSQFTPPATLRPFSLPPATRAGFGSPMFYTPSPALRYSVSSALAQNAQSSVVQRAAGSETTVFAPISGTRKMFDGGKGGGIIDDYNAPPTVTTATSSAAAATTATSRSGASSARDSPQMQPRSSPQPVLQPAVQSNLSSPPTATAPAAPAARGGLSSFFGSLGSLWTGGLTSPPASTAASASSSASSARPASSSASTLSKTTSIFSFLTLARAQPPTQPQPQPRRPPLQPPQQTQVQPPQRPAPARSATPPSAPVSPTDSSSSAPPLATASMLSPAGFSASGPCILDMPRGLIPLPARGSAEAAEIIALYDAELAEKGRQWIGLLNPLDGWRRSFAPSMYLKLLTASQAAKDSAEPEPAPSSAAASTEATPRTGEESAVATDASASEENAAATESVASAVAADAAASTAAAAVDDAAPVLSSDSTADNSSSAAATDATASPPAASTSASAATDASTAAPASAAAVVDDSAIPALLFVSSFDGVIEQCIRKDLARTFPAHRLFTHRHGLSRMYNVLRAYARFDPAVGYSQGMAFLVGVLMMHLGPPWELTGESEAQEQSGSVSGSSPDATGEANGSDSAIVASAEAPVAAAPSVASCPSEECLFWCLVSLMQGRKHNLQGLYTDDCEGLRLILRVLSLALAESDPALASHFESQGIEVSLFATSWFVSVFSYRFELEFTSCAWSHFLEVGPWYLVVLALGILRYSRASLLSKHFESLLPFLSTVMLPSLPHDLPDTAFAEIEISQTLKEQLAPQVVTQSSYKKRK